jgi:hypothetical protein
MRYPPAAQLPQDRSVAAHGHLPCPLAIDSEAASSSRNRGRIDQLDLQLFLSSEVANDHTIVRFGTRHAPFYQDKSLGASLKSNIIVYDRIHILVHTISSTSR